MNRRLWEHSFRWLLDEALHYAKKIGNPGKPGRLEGRSRTALICWYCEHRAELLTGDSFILEVTEYSRRRPPPLPPQAAWPTLDRDADVVRPPTMFDGEIDEEAYGEFNPLW
jgi:hypothetical protein